MSYLDKCLSHQEIASLKSLKASLKETMPSITCVGLYNHGKSSLLNVLINDVHFGTFKVADARETIMSKKVAYQGVQYIDTPGLNAQEKDDKKVMKSIETTDITLFVHTLTTGELNEKEVSFLQYLERHWRDAKEFIAQTIFVLTRTDQVIDFQDIARTEHKVKQQIQDIFHCKPMVISVSSNDYATGRLEQEDALVHESNIKVLESEIAKLVKSSKHRIHALKAERFEAKYRELSRKISGNIENKQNMLTHLKKKKHAHCTKLQQKIVAVERTLRAKYASLS